MNRIVLILIGLLCAIVTAAGIMRYNNNVYYTTGQLGVSTSIPPLDNKKHVSQIEEIKEAKEAKENKEEVIDFTGTVLYCGLPKGTVSAILIGSHIRIAEWIVWVKIKDVSRDNSAIQPGKKVAFLVHSPVQLLHESGEKAVGKEYKFRFTESRTEKGQMPFFDLKTMDEIIKERQLLNDKDASVRRKALLCLVAEGDTESIPEIKKLLNDKDEQVRKDAAEALEHFDRLEKYRKKTKEGK